MSKLNLISKNKNTEMNRALRDIFLESSEQELREALSGTDIDFDSLAAQGRDIAQQVLANFENTIGIPDLHRGLGALVRLLRRRDHILAEQLASKARIDIAELHKIENDPSFEPNPRTIYQLEQYFNLKPRSLVILSGAVHVDNEVVEEALQFAASAQNISELSKGERQLLNSFVKFLQEYTDK